MRSQRYGGRKARDKCGPNETRSGEGSVNERSADGQTSGAGFLFFFSNQRRDSRARFCRPRGGRSDWIEWQMGDEGRAKYRSIYYWRLKAVVRRGKAWRDGQAGMRRHLVSLHV